MGLDTDTRETEQSILDFIRQSHIPMLTINLLHALPKTPLWRRLEQEGRLVFDEHRESNIIFRMPYEQVLGMWRNCVRQAYAPEFLYERFLHNMKNTYARRIHVPLTTAVTMRNVKKAANLLLRIFRQIGFHGSYRKAFWKMAWQTLKSADIQSFLHISLVAHHLIEFARQCEYGKEAACFYAQNSFKEAA